MVAASGERPNASGILMAHLQGVGPCLGRLDVAQMELDPSQVVQLHAYPGSVVELGIQLETLQIELACGCVITFEPRPGGLKVKRCGPCLLVVCVHRQVPRPPRKGDDFAIPSVSKGDSGEPGQRVALTADVSRLPSDM